MTLTENFYISIMQGHGWRVSKEYAVNDPDDHWWKAQLDEETKVSHYTVTGLFEAWMEHPKTLEKHFNVKVINPPKVEKVAKERQPIEGV